ncbi:RNA polymerase-associated protein LEO1-like [Mya arenaria]|uniref:RNA polymerase-associated protein LEO1-like n=1 Tax=Mya arenaria TaxID=6604 RepID=UPI0022E47E94|nr:RNA polymerase-associated protein LEO1-like [Mya arenaria]
METIHGIACRDSRVKVTGKATPGKNFKGKNKPRQNTRRPVADGKGDARQTPKGEKPNRKRKGEPRGGPSPNKQQKQEPAGNKGEKKKKKRGGVKRNKGITDNMPIKNIPNLTELLQKATHAQRAAQKELDKTDRCKLFVKNFPISYKEPELKALSKDISAVDIHQNRKGNFRFGYLTFSSEKVAETNHKALQGKELDGTKLYVDFCGTKAKKGVSSIKEGKLIDPFKLYISHINQSTSISELRGLFPESVEIWIRISENAKNAMVFFESAAKAMKKLGAVGEYLAFYGLICLNKEGQPLTRDAEREFVTKKKVGYKMERFDEPGNNMEDDDNDDEEEDDDDDDEEEEETIKKVVKMERFDEPGNNMEDDDDNDDDEEEEKEPIKKVIKKEQKKGNKNIVKQEDKDDDDDEEKEELVVSTKVKIEKNDEWCN